MSNDTTASDPMAADSPLTQAVALRWKHAVGVFVVGTATYALYQVGGGWTIDAVVFGLALPSRDKFANSVADSAAVGKSFGFFFTGLSPGAVISPVLLGVIISSWSVSAAFVVVGGLLVLAASVVVVALYTKS